MFIIGSIASMMINFRKELIVELAKEHEVFCLCSDYDDESRAVVAKLGATAIDYSLNSKGLNPIKDLFAFIGLCKILKYYKPDVVFCFFVKPVIYGAIASKFSKIKRVIGMIEGLGNAFVVHKNGVNFKTKLIKYVQVILYKISLPLLDALVFLNKDDKNDLINAYGIKTKQIYILGGIGVDLTKFSYQIAPIKPVSFIFVARLLAEKGIFEYIQAAKVIKEKYKYVKFYVLGSFDENNPFSIKQDEMARYVAIGAIEFIGFVKNVKEHMSNSSVFVLPSYYREGVPRSTQEAMAIGRAVITTNSVGCKETVKDGVNGFLVPPYDSKILAEKMIYFIQNPDKIVQMGTESRKIAEEKFDINKKNKKLISIIFNG